MTDNHKVNNTAIAGNTPQLSRNYPAIRQDDSVADWSILPAERIESTELPGEYIHYTSVNESNAHTKPASASIFKPMVVVVTVGACGYGAFVLLAWLIVQWKFWATMGVFVLTAIVWENIRTPPRRLRTYKDTPNVPTKGHTETSINRQINIYHSGNGDINVKIK